MSNRTGIETESYEGVKGWAVLHDDDGAPGMHAFFTSKAMADAFVVWLQDPDNEEGSNADCSVLPAYSRETIVANHLPESEAVVGMRRLYGDGWVLGFRER